jgi:molybdopterin-guanine dinucleotide biosynthesis protein MobB
MKKTPIVSIVGYSGSGKTTLVEKMIPELKRRGWRVATIKHNRHGFEIDHEGKDRDRKSTRLNSSHLRLSRMPSSA